MDDQFNIMDAMTGNVRRLRHITRYSSFPCLKPESVAEHSWQVAFVSYLLALDFHRRNYPVVLGDVLAKAVTHDISESMSGDIIRTYKYSSPEMRAQCELADVDNMHIFVEDYGVVGADVMRDWTDAKSPDLEGCIVRFADLVVVVTYCAEEWHLGNRQMDGTLERAYRSTISAYHGEQYFGKYVDQMFPNKDHRDAYRQDPDLERYQGRGDAYSARAQLAQTHESSPAMPGVAWHEGMEHPANPIMKDASEGPVASHDDWPMPKGLS